MKNVLYYDAPAAAWEHGLPVGNGRIGAMFQGEVCEEVLQIDGCFGFTAGIAEMLVQDADGEVKVLPAIPEEWKCGYVKGLRLRNGKQIEIRWNEKGVESRMYR